MQAVLGDIMLGKLWIAQLKLKNLLTCGNFHFFWPFLNKTTEYIWVTLVCSSFSCMNLQGFFCKIWMQVLQIIPSFICMTVLLSYITLLFGHRNALSPIQVISPKTQPPTLSVSFTHTHTHSCRAFQLIGIDIRTVPPPVKASHWWWTAGPSLARWSRQFHLLLFFCLGVVGGGARLSSELKYQIIVIIMIIKS